MESTFNFKKLMCAILALGMLTGTPVGVGFAEEGSEASEPEKKEEPKKDEPKKEDPKPEEPKKEDPKPDEPKKEDPKPEDPKPEDPKKEDPSPSEPDNNTPSDPGNSGSGNTGDNPSSGGSTTPPESADPTPSGENRDPGSTSTDTPTSEPSATSTPVPATKSEDEHTTWKDIYSGWHGVVNSGEKGMDIPVYYQTDYPRTLITIDGVPRSVKSSGCGITCMSMIIAYLTGNTEQNPTSLFTEAIKTGLYWGSGWTHAALTEIGKRYGVHTKWIGNDPKAIKKALREGKPVIAHMGPGIFTNTGHFVVLRGLTSGGKILMNDPVSVYKTGKAFPIYTLLAQARNDCAFCICWTDAMLEAEEDEIPIIEEIEEIESPDVIEEVEPATESAAEEESADEATDETPDVVPEPVDSVEEVVPENVEESSAMEPAQEAPSVPSGVSAVAIAAE